MARGTRLDRANWSVVQKGTEDPISSTKGNIYVQETSLGTKLWLRAEGEATWSDTGNTGGIRKKAVLDFIEADTEPPRTREQGDRYLIGPETPLHAEWTAAGVTNHDIVEYDGVTWIPETPEEGWSIYVDNYDRDAVYIDDGTGTWELQTKAPGYPPGEVVSLGEILYISAADTSKIIEITDGEEAKLPSISTDLIGEWYWIQPEFGGSAILSVFGDDNIFGVGDTGYWNEISIDYPAWIAVRAIDLPIFGPSWYVFDGSFGISENGGDETMMFSQPDAARVIHTHASSDIFGSVTGHSSSTDLTTDGETRRWLHNNTPASGTITLTTGYTNDPHHNHGDYTRFSNTSGNTLNIKAKDIGQNSRFILPDGTDTAIGETLVSSSANSSINLVLVDDAGGAIFRWAVTDVIGDWIVSSSGQHVNSYRYTTLDTAYDGPGGSGSGRTITADNGAVVIAGAGGLQVDGTITNSSGALTINPITYTRIGDAETPTYAANANDLFVSEQFEVAGVTDLLNTVKLHAGVLFDTTTFTYGGFKQWTNDGLHFGIGHDDGTGNHNLVFCSALYLSKNYDHSTLSTNPTIFLHSANDPDGGNTEWMSFTHDQTDAVIATGKGDLILSGYKGVKIGTQTPTIANVGGDDLFVSGRFQTYAGQYSNFYSNVEFWAQVEFNHVSTRFIEGATVNTNKRFNLGSAGARGYFVYEAVTQTNEALFLALYAADPTFIICTAHAPTNGNYGQSISVDPTLYIYSATDPGTATDEWVSFTHDQTDGVITTGTGNISLQPAGNIVLDGTVTNTTGILTINPASYTRIGDAGTTNHSLSADGLLCSGWLEVAGLTYFDSTVNLEGQTNQKGDFLKIWSDKLLTFGSIGGHAIGVTTVATNDQLRIGLDSNMAVSFMEKAGRLTGTNFNRTVPTLLLHGATVTNYGELSHDNTDFNITTSAGDLVLSSANNIVFGNGTNSYGTWGFSVDDGLQLGLNSTNGQGNNNLILCAVANIGDDYDHLLLSDNPTFILHSSTAAGTATDEWLSLTHNQTDAVISTGTGGFRHNFTDASQNSTSQQLMLPLDLDDDVSVDINITGHGFGMVTFASTDGSGGSINYAFFSYFTDEGIPTVITLLNTSSNISTSSVDGDLCIYGGPYATTIIIENRLGESGKGAIWLFGNELQIPESVE